MMEYFLIIAITLVFRGLGDLVDGFSDRKVNWWLWHVLNWLRRDVVVLGIYLWMFWGLSWEIKLIILELLAGVNLLIHDVLYKWAVGHRYLYPKTDAALF